MWRTETEIEISAGTQEIYDYLADFGRHEEWSEGLEEIEPTPSAEDPGREFVAREKVPAKFTSYCRVTALEPPVRIEWEAWDNRTFRVEWQFELVPNGTSTRVVQRATFMPQNLLGRALLVAMRRRQIPKENARSLARLKERLES